MTGTYQDLTITPTDASSSAEINAYYILDMAYGAQATGPAGPTPTRLDYAWEDPAAWTWLRSQLSPQGYADLATQVWGHGHAGDDAGRFARIVDLDATVFD